MSMLAAAADARILSAIHTVAECAVKLLA